ncbi:MAG: restriction endonuclease [Lachnospiraceae bacterium]|nr:restriction endonuclease [Lachnospiraceae bacterium]
MDGSTFERFCAELLKKNGYRKVRLTEATGDHGIDILADKDGVRYAIQCKCYEGKVGNKAVQEAYSGRDIYEADRAVVLINNYFTPQAEEDAEALGVLLWDREALLYLMRHGG